MLFDIEKKGGYLIFGEGVHLCRPGHPHPGQGPGCLCHIGCVGREGVSSSPGQPLQPGHLLQSGHHRVLPKAALAGGQHSSLGEQQLLDQQGLILEEEEEE